MILITSAAYVSQGLVAEFGQLPPCMLPLQNKRLYLHQIELMKAFGEDIYISLPKSYIPTMYDACTLDNLGVKTVSIPDGLSLGMSVIFALNRIARFNEPLRLLHGDTLLGSLPANLDVYSVSEAKDDYSWAPVEENNSDVVYTGYFSFSSQLDLIRLITEKGNSFIGGVNSYRSEIGLESVRIDDWFDFGMVNSYYRSKSKLTTERSFNNLEISSHSVCKMSRDVRKMKAEANWFNTLPKHLKHYAPTVWDSGIKDGMGYYETEYLYHNSLADLYVFGHNPLFVWKNILNSCAEFVCKMSDFIPNNRAVIAETCVKLYRAKTMSRLHQYCNSASIDPECSWSVNGIQTPSLNAIVDEVSAELDIAREDFVSLYHGDLCFSNILFDFKSQDIKVLDPRGVDADGNITIYGDIRYDVAKLAHSVIGLYDYIIGGLFNCVQDGYSFSLDFPPSDLNSCLKDYFLNMKFAGHLPSEMAVYPIMIHFFLSMLPLHSDHPDLQQAMLANALRLYVDYKNQN